MKAFDTALSYGDLPKDFRRSKIMLVLKPGKEPK